MILCSWTGQRDRVSLLLEIQIILIRVEQKLRYEYVMREIQSGEYGCKIQLIKYNYAHNSKSTVATNLITIVTAHKDAWATERKEAHSNHPLLLPFIIMERDKICRIKRNLLTIKSTLALHCTELHQRAGYQRGEKSYNQFLIYE